MSTITNDIKRTYRKAKRFVRDHKTGFIIGGSALALTTLGIKVYKGMPDYTIDKETVKNVLDGAKDVINESSEKVWRIIDIDPDMAQHYTKHVAGEIASSGDVLINKCFPDIQEAGGWLMDNWDKIPGFPDDGCGVVTLAKNVGANRDLIQVFCQLG